MPGYNENDLKAIESLMTFDDVVEDSVRPQAKHFVTTNYAKGDLDQFASLMNFDVSARQPEPIQRDIQFAAGSASETLDTREDPQPFYTKSDLSLFGRIPLPGSIDSIFHSATGSDRATLEPAFSRVTYTSQDLETFSDLMKSQSVEADQPASARRGNAERATTMKIVDVDKERAAERRNFWNSEAGMKIVFSDAKGRGPRAAH